MFILFGIAVRKISGNAAFQTNKIHFKLNVFFLIFNAVINNIQNGVRR